LEQCVLQSPLAAIGGGWKAYPDHGQGRVCRGWNGTCSVLAFISYHAGQGKHAGFTRVKSDAGQRG